MDIDSNESGNTVILLHINSNKIISINCGDSRAILITKNKKVFQLSIDYKPELPEEKKELKKMGEGLIKLGEWAHFELC